MDYSLYNIPFLVRNDLAEYLQTKLPKTKDELTQYFYMGTSSNLLSIAMKNKSKKCFDLLLNHIREYKVLSDFSYYELFTIAIGNFSQHSDHYYVHRIIDEILDYEDFAGTEFRYLRGTLEAVLRIKYEIKVTKETKKLNQDLKIDLVKHIINHPKFKFEKFIETSGFTCHNILVWKVLKEKVIKDGIDIKKFLNLYISKQQTCGGGTLCYGPATSELVRVLTKDELQIEITIYGVPMTVQEAILITRRTCEEYKIKLTDEKEEQLIEIFNKLKTTDYSSSYFMLNMFETPMLFTHRPSILNTTYSITLPKMIKTLLNSTSKKFLRFLIENIIVKIEEMPDTTPYPTYKAKAKENIDYLKTLL